MIREIIKPETDRLVINIPKEYIHQEVEVLVFPILKEEKKTLDRENDQNLLEFRRLMQQARKSDIKVPKEVDIDNLIDEINDDLY